MKWVEGVDDIVIESSFIKGITCISPYMIKIMSAHSTHHRQCCGRRPGPPCSFAAHLSRLNEDGANHIFIEVVNVAGAVVNQVICAAIATAHAATASVIVAVTVAIATAIAAVKAATQAASVAPVALAVASIMTSPTPTKDSCCHCRHCD